MQFLFCVFFFSLDSNVHIWIWYPFTFQSIIFKRLPFCWQCASNYLNIYNTVQVIYSMYNNNISVAKWIFWNKHCSLSLILTITGHLDMLVNIYKGSFLNYHRRLCSHQPMNSIEKGVKKSQPSKPENSL